MKDQGTDPFDLKLNEQYWIMVDKKPCLVYCVMINVHEPQNKKAGFVRNYHTNPMMVITIEPSRENKWGYGGKIPAFKTKEELITWEIIKLQAL